jgi:hypothetical protein
MSRSRLPNPEVINSNVVSATPPATLSAHLVRLSLLEAVQPPLLASFLQPYASYLSQRDVAVEAIACDPSAIGRLHAVLNAVDPEMPPALQQALVDIADLATEGAHDQLLAIARSQQLSLFGLKGPTTPEDLAFRVYLERPDLFRSAQVNARSTGVRRFVEFVASDATPLLDASTTAKRLQLAALASAYFAARNRTGYCEVRVHETASEITFVVIHGRPPRNHGAIESEDSRTRVAYVPDKEDTLVFDRRSGRLAINAQYTREQDFYRSAVGRVFWGDDDHFVSEPVYTGEPLVLEGPAALGTHGVPGLREVALRELKLKVKLPGATRAREVTIRGDDLARDLRSEWVRSAMGAGAVVAFKLALSLTGRSRPVVVEVLVPNDVSFDRRVGAEVVREYLLESGFMRVAATCEPQQAGAA